jgi:hypothetical protein
LITENNPVVVVVFVVVVADRLLLLMLNVVVALCKLVCLPLLQNDDDCRTNEDTNGMLVGRSSISSDKRKHSNRRRSLDDEV